ncbi:MAG: glucosamine--fructose-6-phosphate aminotransferase (isomerizing) [Chlamydiales bacterium]|jgi:glucosamine--fructose-6-phosphate aminotransferase (isomerizing)
MCGIFGYIGSQDAVKISIAGLKKLEYRGYDSSGIAGLKDGILHRCRAVGKVAVMEEEALKEQLKLDIAIAHTRWATHGKPTVANAHPHFDSSETMTLVHNGIIENFDSLRTSLKERGVVFSSETDTEVIVQLISSVYNDDILEALQKVMPLLQGSFSIALVHKDYPGQIIAAAKESPLVIGIGNGEAFIASDTNAFLVHTKEVIFLHDSEIAVVKADSFTVYDETAEEVIKQIEELSHQVEEASKGDFEHFMLKEIFEQPQTIRNALLSRFMEDYGTASLDGLNFEMNELFAIKRILILACGTSWHAGYVSSYMIEDKARIPVQVEISSEFRYKNPIVQEGTLVIAISQSGETADTVAAVRELKSKGAKVLAICNVQGSTLTRIADSSLFLRAGTEIGVASTKAFTSQLIVLALFALQLARMRHMSKSEGQDFLQALSKLPEQVQRVLDGEEKIEYLAKKYAKYENFFFLGRHYMYPTALEGALKLKEISYVNANGYPAGEMKHGPIALINESCPTVAFCANKLTIEKTLSNLMEIKARNGLVLAIAEEGTKGLDQITEDIIWIPKTIDELAPITSTVAAQLFAYYIAKERGTEIDQPRNLAKSVTVE